MRTHSHLHTVLYSCFCLFVWQVRTLRTLQSQRLNIKFDESIIQQQEADIEILVNDITTVTHTHHTQEQSPCLVPAHCNSLFGPVDPGCFVDADLLVVETAQM